MSVLPLAFVQRMQALLGEETEAFLACFQTPAFRGLRSNPLKVSAQALAHQVPWQLTPVPWCTTGCCLPEGVAAGKYPFHAAGLYYLQEPSAMAVAELVAPEPGELVLDLAAAPGGKSTHLAALASDQAMLVANEIEAKRVAALASNLERWGAHRVAITRDKPTHLVAHWGAIFDRVLVDAPCSGEGMFRKNPSSMDQWSVQGIQGCAQRQQRLLADAAELVRPGGRLVYSTCTFAPEENEGVIANFLRERPDFQLAPLALPGSAPGRPDWVAAARRIPELTRTIRLWPHRVAGEGHFVAVLIRESGEASPRPFGAYPRVPRRIRERWAEFVHAHLQRDPAAGLELAVFGKQVYAIPAEIPPLEGLSCQRVGLWLGTLHQDRLEPSHALALSLCLTDAGQFLDLSVEDPRCLAYLQGQTLREPGEDGWLLIGVAGHPLAWGRRAKGIIKNALPKGLRWR